MKAFLLGLLDGCWARFHGDPSYIGRTWGDERDELYDRGVNLVWPW